MKKARISLLLLLILGLGLAACGSATNTPSSGATTATSGTGASTTATTSGTPLATVTSGAGATRSPGTTAGTTTTASTSGTTTPAAGTTATSGASTGTTTAGAGTTATSGTGTTATSGAGTTTTASTGAGTPTVGATRAATSAAGTTATSGTGTTATSGAGTNTTPSASGVSQQDTGLPLLIGLVPITVNTNFEQLVASVFAKSLAGTVNSSGPIRYKLYTSKDSVDKIFTYYDGEMTKQSLTKIANPTIPTISGLSLTAKVGAYAKSGSTDPVAGVVVFGPMDATVLTALSALDPTFGQNVKAGDNVVMLVNDGVSVAGR